MKRTTRLSTQLHNVNELKEKKKTTSAIGGKLLAYFASAVYNKDTGQILDYKKLISHNKKETHE